jgi:hypothetical protein
MSDIEINKDVLEFVEKSLKLIESINSVMQAFDDVIDLIPEGEAKVNLISKREELFDGTSNQINLVKRVLSELG